MKIALYIGGIYWFTFLFLCTDALVELTNIECIPIDKPFSDFEYCHIKAVNRTYKYLSVKANLFKVPVNNVTVKVEIRKKSNGYKPFLYTISVDGCKFMKERKNSLFRIVYSFIENYSNINHTCPYNHDVFIERLDVTFLNSRIAKLLPITDGEYVVRSTWIAYNVPRAHVNIYGRYSYNL